MSYDEIIVYGVAGFVLFGGMAPVAAQLADKFSRSLLMVIFHFGIGAAAILAAFTQTVWQLAVAIGLIGTFAAIYHPVGIAMLIKSNRCIGFRLGINGVFGNMGVAAAPLIAGILLTIGDWRLCFILPGLFCLGYGVAFIAALREDGTPRVAAAKTGRAGFHPGLETRTWCYAAIDCQWRVYFWCYDFCCAALFRNFYDQHFNLCGANRVARLACLCHGIFYPNWRRLVDRQTFAQMGVVHHWYWAGSVYFSGRKIYRLCAVSRDARCDELCFWANSDNRYHFVALCSG